MSGPEKSPKHHIIPRMFLERWADSRVPSGHEPYVWVYSREYGAATVCMNLSPASSLACCALRTRCIRGAIFVMAASTSRANVRA